MDLIVYEKDCAWIDLERPRLEMLKKGAFNIAVQMDKVVLILENKNAIVLKNRFPDFKITGD